MFFGGEVANNRCCCLYANTAEIRNKNRWQIVYVFNNVRGETEKAKL